MNDERPGGSIRIGDSEREDAVRRLGEHYEAGRLSADEHSERVERALKARTGADLEGLFADLPGAHQATTGDDNEGWAGPWGWRRPPWTAPENAAGAAGPGGASGAGWRGATSGPGAGGQRPQWAARGPLGRIPFPLLILLGVAAVMLSIGCTVIGGHPPVLPLLLIVAAVLFVRKRRMEGRA
ncbi:uncharacterized protein DUF1707 [Kribbella pratensis]|uniref:Uncharacterized protein DUF1707 n=1 Tax=Kribbella pratensis TaxID=2512112 RepID=A0ABY2FQ55_9ACTN|nr:DUF1707 domain-containing protein [Kribbella pratensis]TDW95284.1 uncharacterized protein DUF1707 [Kribbella pratensis]